MRAVVVLLTAFVLGGCAWPSYESYPKQYDRAEQFQSPGDSSAGDAGSSAAASPAGDSCAK